MNKVLTITCMYANIKDMNANIQTLENFIVTRDGEIDGDYYDQLYIEKRKDALKQAGREAVKGTFRTAISVSRAIINQLSEPTLTDLTS